MIVGITNGDVYSPAPPGSTNGGGSAGVAWLLAGLTASEEDGEGEGVACAAGGAEARGLVLAGGVAGGLECPTEGVEFGVGEGLGGGLGDGDGLGLRVTVGEGDGLGSAAKTGAAVTLKAHVKANISAPVPRALRAAIGR